jgi:serine/threonine protein kinase
LGDFGYAIRDEEADAAGCEGTLIYMAPEVARMHYAYEAQLALLATKLKSPLASAKKRAEKTRPHVARESDVFSLGATIHNVAAMSSLTNAGEDVIVAHMGLSLQASAILTLNEKKIPESLFPVVTKMLKRDPQERPSARAALELMNAV